MKAYSTHLNKYREEISGPRLTTLFFILLLVSFTFIKHACAWAKVPLLPRGGRRGKGKEREERERGRREGGYSQSPH